MIQQSRNVETVRWDFGGERFEELLGCKLPFGASYQRIDVSLGKFL